MTVSNFVPVREEEYAEVVELDLDIQSDENPAEEETIEVEVESDDADLVSYPEEGDTVEELELDIEGDETVGTYNYKPMTIHIGKVHNLHLSITDIYYPNDED